MNRKLVLIGTVAAFGFAAVVAGAGDSARAVACDENAKAATASSSCTRKVETTGAAKVHGAMVKSAVAAPGAATIVNAAAFGAKTASAVDCSWCPEKCADAATAAAMGCTEYSAASLAAACAKGAAKTAAVGAGCASEAAVQTAAVHASSGCDKGAVKTASVASGCDKSAVKTASVVSGCDKSATTTAAIAAGSDQTVMVAAGGDACCKSGNAAAKTASKKVCDETQTATALKGAVDELPYRENKRVVLAGAYVCGSCTLHVTEGCAPMFKTTDGKIYPLLKNTHASDLRTADAGNGVEIASSVKKIDGIKYLEVKSFKAL